MRNGSEAKGGDSDVEDEKPPVTALAVLALAAIPSASVALSDGGHPRRFRQHRQWQLPRNR